MAKSKETFNKKEKEKKRLKQKQEKREKMEERKANASKSKSLDDMMAYVDEDGNLTSTPPDPTRKRKEINAEDIEIGVPKYVEEEAVPNEGHVGYFHETKGFGFIIDKNTKERIFFHVNQTVERLQENDKVFFEVEKGPKGWNAVRVRKK